MKLFINWVISTLAVLITSAVLPGVHIHNITTALMVALVLGIINALLKPLLFLITLPITIMTLGLFTFVINALLILLVSHIVRGFVVDGFWWALFFSIVLSFINSLLHQFVEENEPSQ